MGLGTKGQRIGEPLEILFVKWNRRAEADVLEVGRIGVSLIEFITNRGEAGQTRSAKRFQGRETRRRVGRAEEASSYHSRLFHFFKD